MSMHLRISDSKWWTNMGCMYTKGLCGDVKLKDSTFDENKVDCRVCKNKMGLRKYKVEEIR
jgi:hypothetical protein